jgi:hypothetical protein
MLSQEIVGRTSLIQNYEVPRIKNDGAAAGDQKVEENTKDERWDRT